MDRELTEEELSRVTAGVSKPNIIQNESDELSLDDLENVLGGVSREVAYKKALEHPELFRKKSLDQLVEEQIKREEIEATREQNLNNGIRR